MAKKVVATLQKKGEGKMFAKLIKMIKNPETGNYNFKEGIVHNDKIKDWFAKDENQANKEDKK